MPEGVRGYCVAYSGGVDSSVLLALSCESGLAPLRAVHVHHGLQAVADDWVLHCERFCAALSVPLEVLRVQVDARHVAGPEAAAREARYAAFAAALRPGEVLMTAHHLDDQAETFLMRALRGAGPRGLAAIRPWSAFGAGWLWRPLLSLSRDDLHERARERGLSWIDDPHNDDARYERVWLRRRLMPPLRERWPAAVDSLSQAARHCAEADELLDDLAMLDARAAVDDAGLSAIALRELSPARRLNLLRWWLRSLALPPPPQTALARLPELLEAPADAEPLLAWPGAELRRYRDRLHAMPPQPPEPGDFECTWTGTGELELPPGLGRLIGASAAQRKLTLRFARGGERYKPVGASQHRTLKNLFQQNGIPPWQRRRTPLLLENGQLIWIGGIDKESNGADGDGLSIAWQRG